MSSLFLNIEKHLSRATTVTTRGAVTAALALCAIDASAAQVYVQPIASVQAETSSNVDLSPDSNGGSQIQGYKADLATVVGIATPRSDTTIKPRLTYQYYPDEKDLNRLEAFLDLTTRYSSPRSDFRMFGEYDHRDEINAQRTAVEFNPVDPSAPATTDTARVRVGATRDIALLAPRYSYHLTPRMAVGASALYQRADYSPDDDSGHVDFDFYQGKGFLTWKLNERTDVSIGAYASKYDAIKVDSQSTSYGGAFDAEFRWSALLSSTFSAVLQSTDITRTQPSVFDDKKTSWGATWGTQYATEISQLQLSLGRSISPTGGGGLYATDAIRLRYLRNLSERLTFTGSTGFVKNRALSSDVSGNDRKYASVGAFLKWMMAPTWFVEGGYEYSFLRYTTDPNSARDNTFSLRFGYQGLPRQR